MESNEYADLDRLAARAEAAPWIDYPPTPAWYPPAAGLWAAGMTITLSVLDGVAMIVALAVLIGLEFALLGWYRSYRGLMPSGSMPREVRAAAMRFVGALLVVVGAVVVLALVAPAWVAPVVALVGVAVVVHRYEQSYAAAAAAARARLA